MSKIVCDVCGTTYQDTAGSCPICGCTQDDAAAMLSDERMMDDLINGRTVGSSFSSGRKKEIFDFDEVNAGPEAPHIVESNPYIEEEYYQAPPRQNTLAIILLTILIASLLLAAAFLFVRIYLPGVWAEESVPTEVTMATEAAAAVTETTTLTVPCQNLILTSGMASGSNELKSPGQKFLINVVATPENTTDAIVFTSADESVATVSSDGQVVAVAEGETQILIKCGDVEIPCKVVCNFTPETEPPVETTVATVPATTAAPVKLKLNKVDITLPYDTSFQLLLVDCDLEQTDVEWRTGNKNVASVSENGWVKAVGYGTTTVTAKYGDQEVSCVVRCPRQ